MAVPVPLVGLSSSIHSAQEMQSGCELRETIRAFILLMASKIRLRPSQAAELGFGRAAALFSVSRGQHRPAVGSTITAQCLVLISILEDGLPQEQWALPEFAGGGVKASGHLGALPGFWRRGPGASPGSEN